MSNYTNEDRAHVTKLVRAAQAGDRAAFGELFERYRGSVLAAARRKLDEAEAHELLQDVFVQAMQKLHQLRTPEAFGGWLRSITSRMAINRILRRSPVVASDPTIMACSCEETRESPLGELLADERIQQLRAGMGRLRELDRLTLTAFYLEGQSLREMSDHFDAPVGTIKRRLHMARRRLHSEVEELLAV